MASARFNLKSPGAKGESLIYLMFSYSSYRLKYSTRQKIANKDWNKSKQRIKANVTGSSAVNAYLDHLAAKANSILLECTKEGETPTPDILREKMDKSLGKIELKKLSIYQAFDEFLNSKRNDVAERTIRKYRTVKNLLQEFDSYSGNRLTFQSINDVYYEKLMDFFYHKKEYVNNTCSKYISTLKTFMDWANKRGHTNNISHRDFKAKRKPAEIIYLQENELLLLFNFDLSKNPRLDRIRDLFCLACFSGLRFSDASQIKTENIKGGNIVYHINKTRETLTIPLNSYSASIIDKYMDRLGFLPSISNQKANIYLKELCELAGLDRIETKVQYRGANKIEIKKPLHQFISFHDARRTFVTLALEKGMRSEVVKKITVHKNDASFKRYIKITDKVKENEMHSLWGEPAQLKAV